MNLEITQYTANLFWSAQDLELMNQTPELALMAPEQARGLPLDNRCDLFSIGCVLYQMISGELAFKGDNALKIMNALALHEPKPLNLIDSTVPFKVAELVQNLMAKKPSERISSANDLIKTIDEIDKVNHQSPNTTNSASFALPTPNLPGQGYQASLTPWYLNWKTGLIILAVIINLGLLAFNYGNFGTHSNAITGLAFGEPIKVEFGRFRDIDIGQHTRNAESGPEQNERCERRNETVFARHRERFAYDIALRR